MNSKTNNKSVFIIFLGVILLFGTSLYAQEPEPQEPEAVFSGDLQISSFGAPHVKFTQINEDFTLLVGGRGGLIINHVFAIGGYVSARVGEQDVPFTHYGGLLEYIIMPMKPIHFSVTALIGAGNANTNGESDHFFFVEPEGWLMVNLTKTIQTGIGASYRYVSGFDIAGVELSGFSANLVVKFVTFH